jgi:sarcosine oxidase delta subunit
MTVKDFIEWLQTQDQGAIVEIVEHRSGCGYYEQGGTVTRETFETDKHIDYTDFRGNQFVKPDAPHFGTRKLLIGATNV